MLDNAMKQCFFAGLTPLTRQVYRAETNKYMTFCNHFSITPILTSEDVLCKFVPYVAIHNVSSSTIKVYLAAVHQLHISQGLPASPTTEVARSCKG